jgi:hypothetical protein
MAITIDLTPVQETRLRALAAGQTVEEYVIDLVMRRLDELDAKREGRAGKER